MTDAPNEPQSTRAESVRAHRFKRRVLDMADGGTLVFNTDGSIDHVDATGAVARSWAPDDPEWPAHAIRFGVQPQDATVAPTSRSVLGRGSFSR